VPGGAFPHPKRDPEGHAFGVTEREVAALEPDRWRSNEDYRFGFDLFNRGYYWEAHEVWEDVWNASGRQGTVSEMLKGLIKLAAAGVKVRQGQPSGVVKHASRVIDHFDRVEAADGRPHFAGIDLRVAADTARRIQEQAASWRAHPEDTAEAVFNRLLTLKLAS
jgi:hypothetical protein